MCLVAKDAGTAFCHLIKGVKLMCVNFRIVLMIILAIVLIIECWRWWMGTFLICTGYVEIGLQCCLVPEHSAVLGKCGRVDWMPDAAND